MKITMPATTALYVLDAMLAAVSPDEFTPVIHAARFEKNGKALRATSTDRYRIHEVTVADVVKSGRKDEGVTISAPTLKRVRRAIGLVAPRRLDKDLATVTIQTIEHDDKHKVITTINYDTEWITMTSLAVDGNYPPVGRLFDEAEAALGWVGEVSLNVYYLGKLQALNPSTSGPGRFKHTAHSADEAPHGRKHRPGPVLVTYEGEGITARGLLQPNLLLR